MTGKELIAWGRSKGLKSQTALARVLGVSRTSVCQWVSGVRDLPPYVILAVDALDYLEEINFLAFNALLHRRLTDPSR